MSNRRSVQSGSHGNNNNRTLIWRIGGLWQRDSCLICLLASDLYKIQRAHIWNLAFQNFSKQISGLEERILNTDIYIIFRNGYADRIVEGKKRKEKKKCLLITKLNEIYWMNKIYTETWDVLYSCRVVVGTEQIRFDQKGQVKNRKRRIWTKRAPFYAQRSLLLWWGYGFGIGAGVTLLSVRF